MGKPRTPKGRGRVVAERLAEEYPEIVIPLDHGVVVDTHVLRLSRLLGLTEETDPVKVERDLMAIWPRRYWSDTTMRMIYHGRAVCIARRPRCDACVLADICPSATSRAPVRNRA